VAALAGLRWLVNRIALLIEIEGEPDGVLKQPASFVEYLGFIGLLIAGLAARWSSRPDREGGESDAPVPGRRRSSRSSALVRAGARAELQALPRPDDGPARQVRRLRVAVDAVSRNVMPSSR
jgi:hypothetical protein